VCRAQPHPEFAGKRKSLAFARAKRSLYASHTVWENRAVFEAWTKSEAFRAAHNRAGDNKPLYLDHPQFEGFEVRQTVGRGRAV
jgi:heme-degrading monooxygenase HmoA